MSEATASAGYAKAFFDFAVSRGADRALLHARTGLDPDDFSDPDRRMKFERFKTLARAASQLCGDPALMLHFGASPLFFERSILGLIIRASNSMSDAVVQMNRYGPLVNDVPVTGSEGRFVVLRTDEGTWFEDRRADPNDFPETSEAVFARLVAHHEHNFPERPPFVKLVHLTHEAPAHRADYERIIKAPLIFGSDRNAALIDESWLDAHPPSADKYVFGIFSAHAEALLKSLEGAKSVRGRLESLLIPMLHLGDVNMDDIAARMGLSRATLYRRLKDEGTSFAKTLDALRFRMAEYYLSGEKASIGEVAYLIGFSDAAAFSRAYKRWTGMSPRAARSAGRGGDSER